VYIIKIPQGGIKGRHRDSLKKQDELKLYGERESAGASHSHQIQKGVAYGKREKRG
jgi:hypothetical protein